MYAYRSALQPMGHRLMHSHNSADGRLAGLSPLRPHTEEVIKSSLLRHAQSFATWLASVLVYKVVRWASLAAREGACSNQPNLPRQSFVRSCLVRGALEDESVGGMHKLVVGRHNIKRGYTKEHQIHHENKIRLLEFAFL